MIATSDTSTFACIVSPPQPDVAVYNANYWSSDSATMTISYAKKHFLQYPTAQGMETLPESLSSLATVGVSGGGSVKVSGGGSVEVTSGGNVEVSGGGGFLLNGTSGGVIQASGAGIGHDVLIIQNSNIDIRGNVKVSNASVSLSGGNSQIQFGDTTVQKSAYTGFDTAGTYEYASITVNNQGKITALSSNPAPAFTPQFYNFSAENPVDGGAAYTNRVTMTFTGTWAAGDFIQIQTSGFIPFSTQGNPPDSQPNGLATINGTLTIYPYYFVEK